MPKMSMVVRFSVIAALVMLGLAIAFVAEHERLMSDAWHAGAGAAAGDPVHLRIALGLLLASLALVACLLFALSRASAESRTNTTLEASHLLDTGTPLATETMEIHHSAPIVPSTEAGRLLAAGALARGFCHEINNALSPIRGFAELLAGEARLAEPQRRQAARIADATGVALAKVQAFAGVHGWSSEHATATHLGEVTKTAAAVFEAALGISVPITQLSGRDVRVNATESEIGQAILHLFAATAPVLGEHDVRLAVRIDSIVGATGIAGDDGVNASRGLEIWSDPFDVDRTKVQLGTLQESWRYGRVQLTCTGHGWARDVVNRLFDSDVLKGRDPTYLSMGILGNLMVDLGGAIQIDTCPRRHLEVALLCPAVVASSVAAPLETDMMEDDLDALIIHGVEHEAEALSRRLGDAGLRVASTTGHETALDLVIEMGPRCRTVLIGEAQDSTLADKVLSANPAARIIRLRRETMLDEDDPMSWPVAPDDVTLGRLAGHIARVTRP